MTSLYISDLHLHESRPEVTGAFFYFLQQEARQAETLYILGDFFDARVGDDDDAELPTRVATELKQLSSHGAKIFFQHGNRDFLLGATYAARCGMQLLPELFVLEVGNERWLLAHGDQFCTTDTAYQQFRQMVRNPQWQKGMLVKSLEERRAIAKQLREKSKENNSIKAEDILDVTPAEIERVMLEMKCSKLIHGHTHRPARHVLNLAGAKAERIVLGEWDQSFWLLRQLGTQLELIQQALA